MISAKTNKQSNNQSNKQTIKQTNKHYLVGGLEHVFSIIYWDESSQLTKSYFSEGLKPPIRIDD
jgi:hypothetical protein